MTLVGIFVGGASSRMGRPKGRLLHPRGGTLLDHLVSICAEAGLPCVLVGDASPYVDLRPDVARLDDAWIGDGPIAGVAALVSGDHAFAISIACDMPFLDAETLRALANDPRPGTLSGRRAGGAFFEPMLTRWESRPTRDAIAAARAGSRFSLQSLLGALHAIAFEPKDPRVLVDWDAPEDIGRSE